MKRENLEADCSNCAALCCVVFAFDQSESFAIDKAAGEVCPNLDDCGQCTVFADRTTLGFKGCIAYDCYGAGQRVTQEVFQGRSWRQDPRLMVPMGAALSVLRRIHEQLMLLRTAADLPLDAAEHSQAKDLTRTLTPRPAGRKPACRCFR
ncbi:hypothetical protein [Roseibium salinum]|uniref:Uncharacterized protein n=1 Tax=Roseibium salinum TaxID=1604349 RepID=A0ABT3R0X9_9HYPH|nr:hypothetical protein [Roseibium sp. DSM 29163]MCX2722741.1 hypothetical protein [Roseibium sp. DSM 29163]